MRATHLCALGTTLAALATATSAGADIIEIAPGANLSSEISALSPGDELAIRVQDGEFGAVTRSRT